MFQRLVLALLLLAPVSALAQTTNSRTFSGTGTSITATGSSLNTNLTNASIAVTGSVTVSGTVAATQSGTWTVQPGNTANTTAWKVDGSAVVQPISGTVSITANSAVNVAQVAGTTTDTNSGLKSAGTLRVVLATDQPALTNKLLVTPDSVALPANQSVNLNQVGGTNVVTGGLVGSQGVGGLAASGGAKVGNPLTIGGVFNTTQPTVTTGQAVEAQATARGAVIVAPGVDGFAITGTVTTTPPSNASTNVAQFGGTNLSTGTGAGGAGIPRVTLSNDSSLAANQSTNVNQLVGGAPSATNALPVQLTDGTGFLSSDVNGAVRYLKTSMIQDIIVSANNSSTANLAAGATFTGTSESTLGVGSIQVNLTMDQNALVQVQQAQQDPGTSWDVVDSWTYTANSQGNDTARTIQATGSSFRVLITNNGAATTTVLRLQSIICPICDALPRGLTQLGNLKVGVNEALPTGSNVIGTVKIDPSSFFGALSATPNGTLSNGKVSAITLDPFGRVQSVTAVTDGQHQAVLRGPEGPQPSDYGLVVAHSIAPALQCPYVKNISVTAATELVTNPGGKALHVCTFSVVLAGAESVSLVEGTGTTCGTGTTGLYGGTSASAALAANGGLAMANDRITIPMQVRGDNLCLLKSAANNASGILVYGVY